MLKLSIGRLVALSASILCALLLLGNLIVWNSNASLAAAAQQLLLLVLGIELKPDVPEISIELLRQKRPQRFKSGDRGVYSNFEHSTQRGYFKRDVDLRTNRPLYLVLL